MRLLRGVFFAAMLAVCLAVPGYAEPFSMFPKAGRLVSPDGRFELRDVAPESLAGELVGASHSLWLTELSSGRSRKLCDYLGLAAVAWSSNDFLVVTQYVGRKTSRALVFAAASSVEPVLLDGSGLIQMVSVDLRPTLRENDHVFVEASRLEEATFYFRVWGYGKHDPGGFRWNCRYSLTEGSVSCAPAD
ncbi:MAG TPA: hypothetical protein VMS18_21715 [Candidatus Binatia bacterium]|nr:hypothetical protein [Candidatus Binatia bacterium]